MSNPFIFNPLKFPTIDMLISVNTPQGDQKTDDCNYYHNLNLDPKIWTNSETTKFNLCFTTSTM